MKKIETTLVGARILEIVCTERQGPAADLKSVVRLAPKFRKAIGDRRKAIENALALGPGEAREKVLAELAASMNGCGAVALTVEDADHEFAKRRFAAQAQWPDAWAEFVIETGDALEAAADVEVE